MTDDNGRQRDVLIIIHGNKEAGENEELSLPPFLRMFRKAAESAKPAIQLEIWADAGVGKAITQTEGIVRVFDGYGSGTMYIALVDKRYDPVIVARKVEERILEAAAPLPNIFKFYRRKL